MKSLQEMCYESLANSIQNAPPQIQEFIIGETRKSMKKNIRDEIINEIDEKIINKLSSLSYIIPEIMEDINESITTLNRPRRNFYKEYPYIDKNILNCAIKIAEQSIYLLENNIYSGRNFTKYNNNFSEDNDSDYIDYIDYS